MAGCDTGELGAHLGPRLLGIERVSSWGIRVEGGRVGGGCSRDECRVDGVRTE